MVYKCFNREQNDTLESGKLLLMSFSCPIMSDSLWPHGPWHTKPPFSLPSPKVCPSPCPLQRWCHPAISSSDALFSFCPQSFPASGTFAMSQLFASGDQNTGTSASIWKLCEVFMLVSQSYLILCDPMYYRPPGSSDNGILQTRILEWVAIFFSRGSSWPRDQPQVSCTASRLFTIWATRKDPGLITFNF